MTVKIGAAAWITAVRPESRCVSAKPSSQNGTALLSAPSTTIGQRWPRSGARPPRPGSTTSSSEQRQRAEDEPAERDDRRLERLDAELDEEERRSPDRGEEQQEGGVAAGHGFVTVIAAGASPCEVPSRACVERAGEARAVRGRR